MDIDRLRLAVGREANATARALALRSIRRKTIPLRQIAEEVTDAVEARIEHLYATSDLGPDLAPEFGRGARITYTINFF